MVKVYIRVVMVVVVACNVEACMASVVQVYIVLVAVVVETCMFLGA